MKINDFSGAVKNKPNQTQQFSTLFLASEQRRRIRYSLRPLRLLKIPSNSDSI